MSHVLSKKTMKIQLELTKENARKKSYDLLPRSFSGYWYISSLQSTSYACMHNEGRERVMQPVHPKGRLGTLVLGTYTVASFLFCICMHTYKMKVPPQKDIYIQLSQSLQWLWNSNSAGRDLAFLFSCYLFFESITIFKRGRGSSIWFGSGSGSFLTGALFFCSVLQ